MVSSLKTFRISSNRHMLNMYFKEIEGWFLRCSRETDLKINNYNNVVAKLNINPAAIGSVWDYLGKIEEVNFEMVLEGRIEESYR